MFVYTDNLFNSLEGESHSPALQRRNTQDSSPFGFKNLCFCSACCLFSCFLGNFPEHVTSLPWFETVSLAWWCALEARIALQRAKLVRFSFSFFPHILLNYQLSVTSHCCQWVWTDHLYLSCLARPWAREREMVASLLQLHCLAEQR